MLHYYTNRDGEYVYLASQPVAFERAGYVPGAVLMAQLNNEPIYTLGW